MLAVLLVASSVHASTSERTANAALGEGTPSPVVFDPATGPITSALTPVAADPGYTEEILALGLDEATAAFLARTRSTVEVLDAHSYVVRHAFPNGATGEEAYHLTAGTDLRPGDPPELTYAVDGDELHYQLRYALEFGRPSLGHPCPGARGPAGHSR